MQNSPDLSMQCLCLFWRVFLAGKLWKELVHHYRKSVNETRKHGWQILVFEELSQHYSSQTISWLNDSIHSRFTWRIFLGGPTLWTLTRRRWRSPQSWRRRPSARGRGGRGRGGRSAPGTASPPCPSRSGVPSCLTTATADSIVRDGNPAS